MAVLDDERLVGPLRHEFVLQVGGCHRYQDSITGVRVMRCTRSTSRGSSAIHRGQQLYPVGSCSMVVTRACQRVSFIVDLSVPVEMAHQEPPSTRIRLGGRGAARRS